MKGIIFPDNFFDVAGIPKVKKVLSLDEIKNKKDIKNLGVIQTKYIYNPGLDIERWVSETIGEDAKLFYKTINNKSSVDFYFQPSGAIKVLSTIILLDFAKNYPGVDVGVSAVMGKYAAILGFEDEYDYFVQDHFAGSSNINTQNHVLSHDNALYYILNFEEMNTRIRKEIDK